MRSVTVLAALIVTAVLLLILQSFIGSADDPASDQHAVNFCPASQPFDGKPPEQSALRPVSSEAEEQTLRRIIQLLQEAQREGRDVDEDPRLWELVRQLVPDQVVVLASEGC